MLKTMQTAWNTRSIDAGYGHGHYDEILKYTDLVLLRYKSI